MMDRLSNNKRIAKNTLFLYFRTFITMIVGLYTGRVLLQALGVSNYGINNVVGGIVGMSSLITGTMSQAISRYVTYALGKNDRHSIYTMFSTLINAQIVMALLVCCILEIAGVWFLNNEASIPVGRMVAANWVLQCSILSLALSLITTPYNSLLIAYEKMGIYAYVSIIDATWKLLICFAVMYYNGDKLIVFSILQVLVSFGMCCFYSLYCRIKFEEAHYNPKVFDKRLFKELTVFSGWNLFNHGAYVFATQGVNMLINVFFGVAFNAARGVAGQVNQAIQSFVNNFTVAFNPQITKNYAAGNVNYAVQLANRGTKFAWLMMYVFIVPVCVEADMLLKIWLGTVPVMAGVFLRLAMFESLAVATGQNLYRLIQADGDIKHYTVRSFFVAGLIFPIVWLLYLLGAPVWASYLVFIIDFLLLNLLRYHEIKRLMDFSVVEHIKICIMPCLIVSVTSFILPLFINMLLKTSLLRFFINIPISILWTIGCCLAFGLTKHERTFLYNNIKIIINKIRN